MANSNVPDESTNVKWMYEGTNSSIDREAYLLGKRINKLEEDKGDFIVKDTTNENLSVTVLERLDYESKVREDPLFAIKKREDEKRRELLSNPVKRKHLQNMLKTALVKDLGKSNHHHKKKAHSSRKHKKKKTKNYRSSDSEEEPPKKQSKKILENAHKDKKLHAALKKALEKDLQENDSSDSSLSLSSSESEREAKHHEMKHSFESKKHDKHKGKFSYKKLYSDDEDSASYKKKKKSKDRGRTKSSTSEDEEKSLNKKKGYGLIVVNKRDSPKPVKKSRRTPSPDPKKEKYERKEKSGFTRKLTKDELEKKRREMMQNADWRNEQRGKNVKQYSEQEKEEKEREDRIKKLHDHRMKKDGKVKTFLHDMKLKQASIGSLEDTVRRKRHTLDRASKD
ncbi:pre-mRNA-splicing factor CWC25 homolog [Clavelina lepadiformis]|uniref:pre-mRNA-splicing factor CWC25 homolog n=1 Tax=Clavelina lepadiformis TaxID=159417 RepID=UPI0040415B39